MKLKFYDHTVIIDFICTVHIYNIYIIYIYKYIYLAISLVLWFTWNWRKAWVMIEKTALEISVPVKMTGRELHMIDSSFSQLIILILNLLKRLSLFHCFSFHCFTVLSKYVHVTSEFTVYSWVSNPLFLILGGVGIFSQI